MNTLTSESHWPETPKEYFLQVMWLNSVKCGLFHHGVSTNHLCLLDPTINIDSAGNIKFFPTEASQLL